MYFSTKLYLILSYLILYYLIRNLEYTYQKPRVYQKPGDKYISETQNVSETCKYIINLSYFRNLKYTYQLPRIYISETNLGKIYLKPGIYIFEPGIYIFEPEIYIFEPEYIYISETRNIYIC